ESSTLYFPAPNKVTATDTTRSVRANSIPPLDTKKPECTNRMATSILMTSPADQILVRKPRIRQMPPRNSQKEDTYANAVGIPSEFINPAVPSSPPPSYHPSTF